MTASDRNHVKKSGAWVLRAGRDPTSPAEPNEESLWPGDGPRGPVPRGRDTTQFSSIELLSLKGGRCSPPSSLEYAPSGDQSKQEGGWFEN